MVPFTTLYYCECAPYHYGQDCEQFEIPEFGENVTYETALPVYQDPLQAFALHVLQVDLNLAEHEVVRLGIPVADCQQLLQTGGVQLLGI